MADNIFDTVYLRFVEVPTKNKTRVVEVRSRRRLSVQLGTIKFRPGWRQYVFEPDPSTVFNRGCLSDIESVLASYTSEWRRSLRG